jgi:hypothetical protein
LGDIERDDDAESDGSSGHDDRADSGDDGINDNGSDDGDADGDDHCGFGGRSVGRDGDVHEHDDGRDV